MRLGIFAKTYPGRTLGDTLDAVAAHGFDCIQFNFACAGLPSMPEEISAETARHLGLEIRDRGLVVAAVSGTFNMIHPDARERQAGLRRLAVMAAACPLLGASLITLCTGTRDATDMWRGHPENDSADSWRDLSASLAAALEATERAGVTLGIEPETANVVNSAAKARRLLDEMKTPRLKIIFDAANLFHPGQLPRQREILDEAFDLIGNEIIAAHAKDVIEENGMMKHMAAGKGGLDYDYFLRKLVEAGFSGPLLLHGLVPTEAPVAARQLRLKMAEAERGIAKPQTLAAGKIFGGNR